jgi:hypothetical protein
MSIVRVICNPKLVDPVEQISFILIDIYLSSELDIPVFPLFSSSLRNGVKSSMYTTSLGNIIYRCRFERVEFVESPASGKISQVW